MLRISIILIHILCTPLLMANAEPTLFETCKKAYNEGFEVSEQKIKELKNSQNKKFNLRDYEIEDHYLEQAKTIIFWKDVYERAFTSGFYIGTAVLGSYILQYVTNRYMPTQPQASAEATPNNWIARLAYLAPGFMASPLVSSLLGADLSAGTTWFKNTLQKIPEYLLVHFGVKKAPREILQANVEIEAFRLKFDDLKDILPKQYIEKVEIILDRLETSYNKSPAQSFQIIGYEIENGQTEQLQKNLKKIDTIFRLPLKLKPIEAKDYTQKLDKLLSNYDSDVQDAIRELVAGIKASSKPKKDFDPFEKSGMAPIRRIMYLLGPAGTGKTYLGERLAETLELPFIQMSAADLKELGKSQNYGSYGKDEDSPTLKLTELISKLPKEKRFKNIVIFVDEFDKILKTGPTESRSKSYSELSDGDLHSFFLEFFDRSKSLFKLSDLNVDLDMSSIIFILAGNMPLTDSANALTQRVRTVEFDKIALENRVHIACKVFGENIASMDMDDVETPFSEKEPLGNLLNLIAKDHEMNLGIKPLIKTVEDYSTYLESKLHGSMQKFNLDEKHALHSKTSWNVSIELQKLKFRFSKLSDSLNPLIREKIKGYFEYFNKYPYYVSDDGMDSGRKNRLQSIFQNIDLSMSLPYALQRLTADEESIHKRLDEFLGENYPDAMSERIRKVVDRHIENSESESPVKNVVYFFGAPGLGKTTVAEGIAEALGVPFIELELHSEEDLVGGSQGNDSDKFPYNFEKQIKLSQISKKLLPSDFKERSAIPLNAVLVINEVDSAINQDRNPSLRAFLLNKFLDAKKNDLLLKDLDLPLDISKFLIIMTGNHLIQETDTSGLEIRSAINDRMTLIEFSEITEIGMKNIAKKILDKAGLQEFYDANLVDEFVDEYYKLGIKSLRPLEKELLHDYKACLKKVKDGKIPTCDFDYRPGLKAIVESENLQMKHTQST